MAVIHVTDREGARHQIDFANGMKLMEVLKANDMVRGECGGMKICATCHVLVEPGWYDAVGPASEDEVDLIDGTGEYRAGRSRLSCQIIGSTALDGLKLTLGPDM